MPNQAQTCFADIRNIFLDRDGVINLKRPEGQYVSDWKYFHILPGVINSIARLNRLGYKVIVISNQRGVALGYYTMQDLDSIHLKLQELLAQGGAHIDAFYCCPHDKNECDCRKPKTNLLEQAFRDFPLATTHNSIVIGDSLSDIEMARNFHLPSIFIQGDRATQKAHADLAASLADAAADSLEEAVNSFLLP